MKYFTLTATFILLFFSCEKKLPTIVRSEFIKNIKLSLQDSLVKSDFENLDFTLPIRTTYDKGESFLIKISFKGKNAAEDFLMLHTDKFGKVVEGRIINLIKDKQASQLSIFNGHIQISTLKREVLIASEIVDGSILSLHPTSTHRSLSVPETNLPDVVVTCYISSGGPYLYQTYMWVQTFMDSFGGGGYMQPGSISGLYFPLESPGGNGGTGNYNDVGSTGGFPGGNGVGNQENIQEPVIDQEPFVIDFENNESKEGIDVDKYVKCFSDIPDAGSTSSIEILTDIPVDDSPDKFFNWNTGSTGHAFLKISKSNGNQSIDQYIGFYPEGGWKTLTTVEVDSKSVDNANHEYNASLKMALSSAQLHTVLGTMTNLAKHSNYDLDDFNCTDFALSVFNSTRLFNALEIPGKHLPGTVLYKLSNTPQGLYSKLKSMKASADPEAANISIPTQKAYAGSSHGPCN